MKVYYKFEDVRWSEIGDDCRTAKLLESYCKEKGIGPLNVEVLYPHMSYQKTDFSPWLKPGGSKVATL